MEPMEPISPRSKFLRDTFERVVATYIEAFIALVILAWTPTVDMSIFQAAAWSALPAALSALKSAVATFRGFEDSASLSEHV